MVVLMTLEAAWVRLREADKATCHMFFLDSALLKGLTASLTSILSCTSIKGFVMYRPSQPPCMTTVYMDS